MRTNVVLMLAATAACGQVAVELAPNGVMRSISVNGKPVTGPLALAVPKPQWQGTVLSSDRLHSVQDTRDGQTRIVQGIAGADGQALADVTLRVTPGQDTADVQCEFTPREELSSAAALLRVYLPVKQYSGKAYCLVDGANSRSNAFPETLPTPYAFFSGAGFDRLAFQVAPDVFLALEPDWATVARVSVQDNRRFKGKDYEVQLYLHAKRKLKPGEPVNARVRFRRMSAAQIRAEVARGTEAQRRLAQALRRQGTPAIRTVTLSADEVPAYGLVELSVDLDATYENPFDPDDVSLEALITDPRGRAVTVPGFFSCPYTRSKPEQAERLAPAAGAGWRIRYCPSLPGDYKGRVVLNDGGTRVEHPFAFRATPSDHPGMIRVAAGNPLYLEFDSGAPYFAIGENVCWPGSGGTYDYDNYWKRLAENGANYARLWIGPFDCFTLERVARGPTDHAGLGRIDLAAAWRVDTVLDEAARRGIQIMFCIESFNSLRIRKPHAMWSTCPYNKAKGGPLAKPREFFTNEAARELFKRRLRYIVARWGHLPSLLAWEFWNEVNIVETYVSADVAAWHREMARYLRGIDPYDHLITTSWAGTRGDPAVDGLPEMDYIQSHQYGAHDAADAMIDVCLQKTGRYRKPHYFGEYGTGTRAEGTLEDVDGIHLHNGLWSGIFGNAMGTAMLWWWDNYVEPRNLYHLFKPVAAYVDGIPFNTARYSAPAAVSVEWQGTPPPPRLEDLPVEGRHASWSAAPFNKPRTLVCRPDGTIEGVEQLSRLQHGVRNHPKLHNPVTFQVDYPAPGRFIARVTKVSGYGGAGLRISLDGTVKLDKQFPDTDDNNREITEFNGEYSITVPAGEHTIVVENHGADWVFMDYRLPAYARRTKPPVRLYALTATDAPAATPTVLLWARHDAFNWYRHSIGVTEWPVPPVTAVVNGVPDGRYVTEFWDTLTGEARPGGVVAAEGGGVRIPLPAFSKSIAAKLTRP